VTEAEALTAGWRAPLRLPVTRSGNPFGGILSTVADQVAYASFHLSDGRSASGDRLMSKAPPSHHASG
jgi:hypothetical protein